MILFCEQQNDPLKVVILSFQWNQVGTEQAETYHLGSHTLTSVSVLLWRKLSITPSRSFRDHLVRAGTYIHPFVSFLLKANAIFPICLLGTGKTVVGAYIVSCFVELNSLHPRKLIDPKDEGKKQVILYCGPSNKSVDVVAGRLLSFLC